MCELAIVILDRQFSREIIKYYYLRHSPFYMIFGNQGIILCKIKGK